MSTRAISLCRLRCVGAALFILAVGYPSWAQDPPEGGHPQADLTQVSIENLMNMEVTSVARKEQKLSRTAAAIFVITQEDIAHSGATNIPDLLRMVPGMEVAQINANTWAISARGFNERFSNKLQVMLDGRIIYTPTFGGVDWDAFDLPLENIERIEVIRGPGGSTWGANAVNGVVNVITKRASKTAGAMLVAGGGNLQEFGTAQYGGVLGQKTDYRVYTKYFNIGELPGIAGQPGGDGWHALRGGFRIDTAVTRKDAIRSTGGIYTAREGQSSTYMDSITSPLQAHQFETNLSGGFFQSIWNHTYSERSDTSLRVSFDRYDRRGIFGERRSSFDADFQHHVTWGSRQDVVWGVGYYHSYSETDTTFVVSQNPANLTTQLFSGFIQDEIALIPNRLYITGGTKLEHNDYTGFDALPSVRLTWTPNERQMFWEAVSRATRIPASTDIGIRINLVAVSGPGGVPALISIVGNPRFQNEGLLAYEAGYRRAISSHLSMDLTAFYNVYDHQRTMEPGAPFFEASPSPPHVVLPLELQNLMHGETHGIEIAANWKIDQRWTLSPGYAWEQIHMHTDATSRDVQSALDAEGSSPRHSAQLRSHLEIYRGLSWDTSAFFSSEIADQDIAGHTRIDTGLTWRWKENLTLTIAGQNLVKDRQLEFVDPSTSVNSSFVKRSAYVKLTWQF